MTSSVISLGHTATADGKFHLVAVDLWASDINIHVMLQNAKYGDFDNQECTIVADKDVPHFENVNLKDLFFKNAGAAANTKIWAVGVRMTEKQMKEAGVI